MSSTDHGGAGGQFEFGLANLDVDVFVHLGRFPVNAVLSRVVHQRVGEHQQNIALQFTERSDVARFDLRPGESRNDE